MKNVAFHNLGCKVNSYEIDVMQQMLQEKGYKIVPFDKCADIYIVNTCTVTNIADRKSRQMLHRAKKQNPNAVVVATGCYVQTGIETVEIDEAIDLAVGNNKKKDLVTILEEFLEQREQGRQSKTLHDTTIIDINHTNEYENMFLEQTSEHTRAYIKIQDGCNQFCTYCIIPYARGRVRSRSMADILKEVTALADKGYKEIVLTGIHISSYGIDFEKESKFLELVKNLHEIKGIRRIRLGSLEPRIVTKEFAQELSALPKVCPHFHLSLQSGCIETLKRMNRHYTPEQYYEGVCYLREAFSNPAITTDVITGFPGETEEEFEKTKQFLHKVNFFEMHVFPYSKREGTKAAEMSGQIANVSKKERSRILLQMDEKASYDYRQQFIGKEVEVLFEEQKEINGIIYQIGHTREYVKAACLAKEDLSNTIKIMRAEKMLTAEILLLS